MTDDGESGDAIPEEPGDERTYTRRRVVIGGATAIGAAVVWSTPWPFSESLIGQTIDSAWAGGSTGPTGGGGGGGGGGSTTTTTTTTTTTAAPPPTASGPTAPASLKGRFHRGALVLSWGAATSPGAGISHYEVLRDGSPVGEPTGLSTSVRKFDKKGTTTFTVRAVDSLGKTGPASAALKVVPIPRPAAAPKRIPKWAFELAAWQEQAPAKRGTRPTTPVPLPKWFWAWKAWHLEPYKLAT